MTLEAVPDDPKSYEEMLPAEPEKPAEETEAIPVDPEIEVVDDLQGDGITADENPMDISSEDVVVKTEVSADQNDQEQVAETEEAINPVEEYPVDPETEERQETPDISLTADIEADGLPSQRSIMSVEPVEVPLGSVSFQSVLDFTNIQYDPELDQVELISDEVDVTTPGTYSTIYRITHNNGHKM